MHKSDSDIPEQFRGDQCIIVAELDGSPIIMHDKMNAIMETENGLVHSSQLPVLATINGITEEAEEKIAEIVMNLHPATGTPVLPITRSSILRALVGGDN